LMAEAVQSPDILLDRIDKLLGNRLRFPHDILELVHLGRIDGRTSFVNLPAQSMQQKQDRDKENDIDDDLKIA